MPRQPRYNLIGVPQHIIQRGNNRQATFFAEEDYQRYLSDLKEASEQHRCDDHAFVLITNHVHLLMTPQTSDGIPKTMQSLGRRYVAYVNHTYRRSGTIWEGRYKSALIDSEQYLLICQLYIELNPVRANMVSHPSDYQWSSYQANAMGSSDELIKPHTTYLAIAPERKERLKSYRQLSKRAIDVKSLEAIRSTLNQCQVLGGERFKDQIEQMLKRRVRPGKPGRPAKVKGLIAV